MCDKCNKRIVFLFTNNNDYKSLAQIFQTVFAVPQKPRVLVERVTTFDQN